MNDFHSILSSVDNLLTDTPDVESYIAVFRHTPQYRDLIELATSNPLMRELIIGHYNRTVDSEEFSENEAMLCFLVIVDTGMSPDYRWNPKAKFIPSVAQHLFPEWNAKFGHNAYSWTRKSVKYGLIELS